MTYYPNNPNGQATSANSAPVVIASDQSSIPVSNASLPLPAGAATSAKQPALGTAGSPSSDVITVQGIASGTPQPISGTVTTTPSGTQTISGTVTANAGTNLNTSALALESGGNLAAIKADVDKIPSQGQALSAASMPVVLPAAQITTLTPPTNTGYALDASLTTLDTDVKSNITLHAGTNIIGKVTTDQTTHGTTDLVAADNTKIAGTAVDVNSGNKSAGTQRVVIATDDINLSAINTATAASATAANQTNGTQQTKITDGTNTASVLKSDGTAAGQNSQLVARSHLTVNFSTTTVQAVASTDAANYSAVSVHVTSQGTSSTITFQGSNDNSNWVNVSLVTAIATGSTTPSVSTASANVIFVGAVNFRYFRLNVTGISAGTTAGVVEFLTNPYANNTSSTQVNTASATGAAVPSNAFYIGLSATGTGNLIGAVGVADNADAVATSANANRLITASRTTVYNGTTWDQARSATSASATTGTGLLGVGVLGFDGTNYQRLKSDTSGNINTLLTDGTNTASILKSDGTAAGQNSQMIAGTYMSTTWSISSVTNLTGIDAANYAWVSVQVLSQYTGSTPTITFQGSNDNVNWSSLGLSQVGGTLQPAATNVTSPTVTYSGPLTTRYFRLSFTGAYTSGSSTGNIYFSTLPRVLVSNGIAAIQNGSWTVGSNSATGSAVPANAFYSGISDGTNLVGAKTASAASATTGTGLLGAGVLGFDGTNYQRLSTDTTGLLKAAINASATGAYSFSNIATNTTTTVKSGAGTLHSITMNAKGTGTTATVYDNTAGSGTKIATIDTTLTTGTMTYDIAFATGLTIVTAGTAAADLTISYK